MFIIRKRLLWISILITIISYSYNNIHLWKMSMLKKLLFKPIPGAMLIAHLYSGYPQILPTLINQ